MSESLEDWDCTKCGGSPIEHAAHDSECIWEPRDTSSEQALLETNRSSLERQSSEQEVVAQEPGCTCGGMAACIQCQERDAAQEVVALREEVERLTEQRDLRANQVEEALSVLAMVKDRVDDFTYDEFSSVLEDGPCDDEHGHVIPSPLRRERDDALVRLAAHEAGMTSDAAIEAAAIVICKHRVHYSRDHSVPCAGCRGTASDALTAVATLPATATEADS